MSWSLRQSARILSSRVLPALSVPGTQTAFQRDAKSALTVLTIVAALPPQLPASSRAWWTQQHSLLSALAEPASDTDNQLQLTQNAVESVAWDTQKHETRQSVHLLQRLRELVSSSGNDKSFLRVTVEAGGCSGFSYKFELDDSMREGDRIFEEGGVRLAVDGISLEFVRGAKVDYSQELIKSAFEVIDNPNADKGCGCGTSFSPK